MRSLLHDPSRPGALREVDTAREEWELKQAGWSVVTPGRLGRKLKRWRRKAGLSTEQATTLLRVRAPHGEKLSKAVLKDLLNGRPRQLDARQTRILAHSAGVPVAWLADAGGAAPRPHGAWKWEDVTRVRRTARTYVVEFADGADELYVAFDQQHAIELALADRGLEVTNVVPI